MISVIVLFLIAVLIAIFVRAHKREKTNPLPKPPPEYRKLTLIQLALMATLFFPVSIGMSFAIGALYRLRLSQLTYVSLYYLPTKGTWTLPTGILALLYSSLLAALFSKWLVSKSTYSIAHSWSEEKGGHLRLGKKAEIGFLVLFQLIPIIWLILNFPVYTTFTSTEIRLIRLGTFREVTLPYKEIESIFDADGIQNPHGEFIPGRNIKAAFKNGDSWSSGDWPGSFDPNHFDELLNRMSATSSVPVTKVHTISR